MPWTTVEALRESDLYKRTASLQKMASGKLKRFIEIFNRVHDRAVRGGASPAEAESRALPIALVGAANTTIMPAGRQAEENVATYALFAKDMASSGGGADVDMKFAEIADINDVVAGQTFFGHAHDRDIAEPLGVIRRVVATKDLPANVRAKVDQDIVLVAQTSYFSDVPPEDRLDTISPEWVTAKYASGEEVHIPTTFITTKTPANAAVLGIRRVAEGTAEEKERPYLRMIALDGMRVSVPEQPTIESLTTKVAELQTEVKKGDDLQKKFASLETSHADLVKKLAAIAGIENKGTEAPKEDAVISGLAQKLASMESSLTKVQTDLKDKEVALEKKEASSWADNLLRTKELPMDSKAKYESLYLLSKEAALSVEATLPARVLKPGETRAVTNLEKLDPKKAEAELVFLKDAFPVPGVKA